jgi:hypothetical protein
MGVFQIRIGLFWGAMPDNTNGYDLETIAFFSGLCILILYDVHVCEKTADFIFM